MKPLSDISVLVSAAELGQIVGIDIDTVNNWVRYGIITRARIGGRQLRNRLFSADEVYRTALKNELVRLGIPPSQASEAVDTLWKDWGKKDTPEGWNVYAMLWPSNDNWIVALCSQKLSGGALYKFGKAKSTEEMELPNQTCALIPISDVFDRISGKLSELLGELKNQEVKGKP
jgi:DNA-binding transcriptional MerR regulator